MAKYRKKPVVIEAFKFTDYNEEFCQWLGKVYPGIWQAPVLDRPKKYPTIEASEPHKLFIYTLEGKMTADDGDFIIKAVKGELYPCKPDIFEATYELVE